MLHGFLFIATTYTISGQIAFKAGNIYHHMPLPAASLSFAAKNALILFPCALAITLFLFYIDEGAYTLNWSDLRREWAILLGYVLSIFTAQFLLSYLMRNFKPIVRIPLTVALGIPLGFLLLFGSIALFTLFYLA